MASFTLAEQFVPGRYRLEVGADHQWSLRTSVGIVVDQGGAREQVGEELGFNWVPPTVFLTEGARIDFGIVTPREAARDLNMQIQAQMDRQGNFIQMSLRGGDPAKIASVLNSLMERHVTVAADLKRAKIEEEKVILEEQLQYAEAELEAAERALQEFRISTITLPSDEGTPIAAGLQSTTSPVYSTFFQLKVSLDQLKSDRRRLRAILDSIPAGGVRVEALEAIGALGGSAQLRAMLQELVQARAELRTLRDRYTDDYPPIQLALQRINRIEKTTVPAQITALDEELAAREATLTELLESTSGELTNIPPRTIEEARLQRQVRIQEALYNTLRTRVETTRLAAASSIPDVRILDEARVPDRPSNDGRLKMVLMVLVGFVGTGVLATILLDRGDPVLRDPFQVETEMNLEVLGAIPKVLTGKKANPAEMLEAFRGLRLNMAYAYGRGGPLVVTISSPAQGEGKTLVATNLAVAFAGVGQRTLLIDGDTRLGDAHELVGVERRPGLTDYLDRAAGREIIQKTSYPNLHFIASGSRRSTSPELVAAERMSLLLGALKRGYQVIIIDSPPLSAGGDAMALAAISGALALVVRKGTTNREMAVAKLEALQRFPVRMLGAILNEFQDRHASGHYYSNYLPGYEAGEESLKGETGTSLTAASAS
jgi:succinoglycan biosynthesis transport protein ExoP